MEQPHTPDKCPRRSKYESWFYMHMSNGTVCSVCLTHLADRPLLDNPEPVRQENSVRQENRVQHLAITEDIILKEILIKEFIHNKYILQYNIQQH